jgi:glutathione peroxidase-family protein
MSFYDIVETGADGSEVSFAQYQGSVVYGVNVASK